MDELAATNQFPAIPDVLDIVPLFGTVVYPHTVVPLAFGQPTTIRLLDDPSGGPRLVGLLTLRAELRRPELVRPSDCYAVGTLALVHRLLRLPDDTLRVAVQGLGRFRLGAVEAVEPVLRGQIEVLPDATEETSASAHLIAGLKDLIDQLAGLVPGFNDELRAQIASEEDAGRLSYLIATAALPGRSVAERQHVLELPGIVARLEWLHSFLERELRMLRSMPAAAPALVSPPLTPPLAAPQPQLLAPGTALWLRWSATGGEAVTVEVARMLGRGVFTVTGQRGAAFRDAAQIALAWVRGTAPQLGIAPDFYAHSDLHLHVPPGAPADDAGSAGAALTAALVSLLSGRPLRAGVALSGEITLRGAVLPVGRVREKVLAAQRVGLRTFVLPAANERDLAQMPDKLLADLRCIFVESLSDVLAAVFPRD